MKKRGTKVPIPIRGVDFVMYSARDAVKLRGWYEKLFGFDRGEEWNPKWSEFTTEPVTLCIAREAAISDEILKWEGSPAIAFAVVDIHEAAKACRKRKARILAGPIESRVCWMLFLEDPAGNRLILHQRKDGTAG